MTYPCKGCSRRQVGCHSLCSVYATAVTASKAEKDSAAREYDYRDYAAQKAIKSHEYARHHNIGGKL